MPGAGRGAAEVAPSLSAAEFAALMAPLGPFGPAPQIVVGVSGGPHSLALALLAGAWAPGRVLAAICDHGLRAESAAEAAGVAAALGARGIGTRVIALRLASGPAVQERARTARMAALLGACAEAGAPWLLLGHHRSDQAETVLLRALAGSGPAGLAGMATVRAAAEALVLRPLLGIAPARLGATVAAAGLTPVRDPSNDDPRFERVRLRQALADPSGGDAAIRLLAEAAARLAARRVGFEAAVAARLAAGAALHEDGSARLDLGALGGDEVAQAALGALVRVVGGKPYPPSRAAVARLLARGEGTLGGAVLRRSGLLRRETAAAAVPDNAALAAGRGVPYPATDSTVRDVPAVA